MHVFPLDPYVDSGDRLHPDHAGLTVSTIESNVTLWRAAEYHHLIHAPRTLQFRECTKHERITSQPIDSWVPIYAEYFKVGLRFPILPFILEVLEYHNIVLNQLTPNSMRVLISFITKSRFVRVEPTIRLFHNFYQLTSPPPTLACMNFVTEGMSLEYLGVVQATINSTLSGSCLSAMLRTLLRWLLLTFL